MDNEIKELFRDKRFLMEGFTGVSVHRRYKGSLRRELIYCNRTYADMSGWSREELLKLKDMRSLQHAHHSKKTALTMQRCVETGQPYGGTFSWITPDGGQRCVEYMAIPVERGDAIYVIGFDRLLPVRGERISFN